jgi:hypothetical protein
MAGERETSGSNKKYSSGRSGARMTTLEMVRLGIKLQEARSRPDPIPWSTLSKQLGLPVRTLQYHWRRHKERVATFSDLSGARILRETAHLQTELLERVMEEVERADSSSARVGAIRLANHLLERRVEDWWGSVDHARYLKERETLRQVVHEFVRVFDEVEWTPEALKRLEDVYEEASARDPGLELIVGAMTEE